MRAAIRDDHGLAFVERARPSPGSDDVLVRVRAVALNRADLGVLAGHMHGSVGGAGTILGMEWAGEAVEVGSFEAVVAVTAQVAPAKVVGENEQDVRAGGVCGARGGRHQQQGDEGQWKQPARSTNHGWNLQAR